LSSTASASARFQQAAVHFKHLSLNADKSPSTSSSAPAERTSCAVTAIATVGPDSPTPVDPDRPLGVQEDCSASPATTSAATSEPAPDEHGHAIASGPAAGRTPFVRISAKHRLAKRLSTERAIYSDGTLLLQRNLGLSSFAEFRSNPIQDVALTISPASAVAAARAAAATFELGQWDIERLTASRPTACYIPLTKGPVLSFHEVVRILWIRPSLNARPGMSAFTRLAAFRRAASTGATVAALSSTITHSRLPIPSADVHHAIDFQVAG
jgi:hypothetical protein